MGQGYGTFRWGYGCYGEGFGENTPILIAGVQSRYTVGLNEVISYFRTAIESSKTYSKLVMNESTAENELEVDNVQCFETILHQLPYSCFND